AEHAQLFCAADRAARARRQGAVHGRAASRNVASRRRARGDPSRARDGAAVVGSRARVRSRPLTLEQAMKILVTGSAGHLGEALASTLAASGHEVIGLDLLPSTFTTVVGTVADT